jgi:hypothetical protein
MLKKDWYRPDTQLTNNDIPGERLLLTPLEGKEVLHLRQQVPMIRRQSGEDAWMCEHIKDDAKLYKKRKDGGEA